MTLALVFYSFCCLVTFSLFLVTAIVLNNQSIEQPLPPKVASTSYTTTTGATQGTGRVDRSGSHPYAPSSSGVEWEDDEADNIPALRNQGLASSVERKRGNGGGSSVSDLSNYTPMNKGNRHAGGGSST